VLNGRVYRAGFLPLMFALALAGFSLTGRPAPLTPNLAPDAFDGARAFAELHELAVRFPDRRPGSPGDQALAAEVARIMRGLGGAGGGFSVTTHRFRAQTIDGERTLTTVVAERPGATGEQPIVILAHRDAAGVGAEAELSGTAVLLELARVLAAGETQRTVVLVSTSGGSGGDAGAADFAAHAGALVAGGEEPGRGEGGQGEGGQGEGGGAGPVDAVLVLGDMAGEHLREPLVGSLSEGASTAPALLQSTLAAALAQQAGVQASPPSALAQLAHLVFPLPAGEQAPLEAGGLPAVLLGTSGEQPPPAKEAVSTVRLEGFGRAALATVYALDPAPSAADGSQASSPGGEPATSRASPGLETSPGPLRSAQAVAGAGVGGSETGLPIRRKTIPGWALRLLVAALAVPALLALCDGLARLRRRGERVGRWVAWTLACALPFLACALFAILLGASDAIPAPVPPVARAALPLDGTAQEAVLASALVLVLAWLGWPAAVRRLRLPPRPAESVPVSASTDAAAIAPLLVLGVLVVVVWTFAPLTALLLLPALHLWLLLLSPLRPLPGRVPPGRPWGRAFLSLGLLALGMAPLGLLVAFYAVQLHLGLGGLAHTTLLLLASGRVGIVGAALWSVAFGCLAAVALVALAARSASGPSIGGPEEWIDDRVPITIRGPLSYAGPGSLGGTESTLRR
jgi:hypothetical protein